MGMTVTMLSTTFTLTDLFTKTFFAVTATKNSVSPSFFAEKVTFLPSPATVHIPSNASGAKDHLISASSVTSSPLNKTFTSSTKSRDFSMTISSLNLITGTFIVFFTFTTHFALASPILAVISAVPCFTPYTLPFSFTVATELSLEDQTTVPSLPATVAVRLTYSNSKTLTASGDTDISYFGASVLPLPPSSFFLHDTKQITEQISKIVSATIRSLLIRLFFIVVALRSS